MFSEPTVLGATEGAFVGGPRVGNGVRAIASKSGSGNCGRSDGLDAGAACATRPVADDAGDDARPVGPGADLVDDAPGEESLGRSLIVPTSVAARDGARTDEEDSLVSRSLIAPDGGARSDEESLGGRSLIVPTSVCARPPGACSGSSARREASDAAIVSPSLLARRFGGSSVPTFKV